ncbi:MULTISPECIES: beta-N-acetylhexosaminidase [unclassified Luteococcus]|uniref:beta-N-acetylhexosaminidase n=1 Tax=unclassified Luteococcus TaxID=2639923 RepID=UPI00313B79AA
MTFPLLPQPASVEPAAGHFLLNPRVTVDATPQQSRVVGALLGVVALPSTDAHLTVRLDDSLPTEGYQLTVTPERVTILVGTDAALPWALQTLRQLMPDEVFGAPVITPQPVPCCTITDSPRFGWRGGMIDVARHFLPFADLLRLVDQLAAHKFNRLHLHLADDQGWRFESLKYPELTRVGACRPETLHPYHGTDRTPHGGYYSQAQLRRLVSHAASRGITVVPELDFPGHASAALAAYPQHGVEGFAVGHPATGFGVLENVLNLDDDCLAFVFDLFDELLDVFPSQWIHIGGDEVPRTQWRESEASQQRAAQLGLTSVEELQPWFTRQLVNHLRARGRTPIGWDEVADDGPVAGLVCHAWRSADKALPSARAGGEVIVAPVQGTYLDYYPSDLPTEQWCIGGPTPTRTVYEFNPTDGFEDVADRVIGTQFQLWTEYVASMSRVEYLIWPRACALGEVAWSTPEGRSWDEFSTRLAAHTRRLDAAGINHRPQEGPLPWQRGGHGRQSRGPHQN